jgi:hypothetical protein
MSSTRLLLLAGLLALGACATGPNAICTPGADDHAVPPVFWCDNSSAAGGQR